MHVKSMALHYFDIFAKTITGLPAGAVAKALDRECKMLEEDSRHQRLASLEDAHSILCFGEFVRRAKFGEAMQGVRPLPADHFEFYKKTIVRLVQANELPPSAMEQFDQAFPFTPSGPA